MKTRFPRLSSRRLPAFAMLLVCSMLLICCGKSKDSPSPSSQSHKLLFKAVASAGCDLTNVAYGTDNDIVSRSSLSGTTWQSDEISVPAGTSVATIAIGADGVDASSTLTVQIYVDGKLKKEGKGYGENLEASATYSF